MTSATEFMKTIMTSRYSGWGVMGASLLEATVVPVPLELLLIPMMQLNRRRMWRLALAALVGCVTGALLGYAAGYGFQSSLGRWIISLSGQEAMFAKAGELIRQQGFWFVFSVGITPIPFQIAMLAAGAGRYWLPGFLAATALSRAIRYFGLALLVWRFGDSAEDLYKQHKIPVAITVGVALAALWTLSAFI
ncbi:MAG: VTT domain-containing protein [Desulfobacterales bacterium]